MDENAKIISGRDGEIRFVHMWRSVRSRRWRILAMSVVTSCITLLIGLWLPRIYESTTSVIVPKGLDSSNLLLSMASSDLVGSVGGSLGSFGFPSLTPDRDLFLSILESRTMATSIVREFDLRKHYGVRLMSDAIERLRERTYIAISREGLISLTFEHENPIMAAEIANSYIKHLDKALSSLEVTQATKKKTFIEGRLEQTENDLRGAEERLRDFKRENMAISLSDQARSMVEVAGFLYTEIASAEVSLQVMKTFTDDRNPEVVRLVERIGEMKRQLMRMQYGRPHRLQVESEPANPQAEETLTPVVLAQLPDLGLQMGRRMREVAIHEALYSLLVKELEQARIKEAQNVPRLQVLDEAVPAERHARPKVLLLAVLAGIAGALVAAAGAFIVDSTRASRSSAVAVGRE